MHSCRRFQVVNCRKKMGVADVDRLLKRCIERCLRLFEERRGDLSLLSFHACRDREGVTGGCPVRSAKIPLLPQLSA